MNSKEDFYSSVIARSPIGYAYHKIICDDEGTPCDYEYLEINPSFEKLTNLKGFDILGKRITEIMPKIKESEFDWIQFYGDIAIHGGNKEFEQYLEILNKWYRIYVYSPEKYYFITYFSDISKEMKIINEHKKMEKAIKEAEEKYRTIADYAHDWVTWEDEEGKFKYASPACERISGYTADEFEENKSLFYSIIVESDKEIWDHHRHEAREGSEINSEQFRIRNKDGRIVWIEHTCRQVIDKEGKYLGYRSNNRDITSRRKMEEALKTSEEKYRFLTEYTSDVIWIFNITKKRFTYISPSVFYLRGFTAEEAMNETIEEALTPESVVVVRDAIAKTINKFIENPDEPICYINEIQQPCKNGDSIWVEVSTKYRYNSDEEIEIIGVSRNIEERKKAENKIIYLSYHDQLTGLHNRRFYEEELNRINIEDNLPITLVMADVNGLKLVNDAFGHLAGDDLLKKFSTILKNQFRGEDIIARVGGDEFVFLLPKTDRAKAERIVKRIKSSIAKEKGDKTILSVSFGWATKNTINEEFGNIYMQAEDHMYRQKLLESMSVKSKTIKLITKSLYKKNGIEEQHGERVSKICKDIGIALDLSSDVVDELGLLGLFHDIGKIGISENILNKSGALDENEWAEIKRHPEIAYQILRSVNEFVHIAEYVLVHHERIDGMGYPRNLRDTQIPLQSKILSIAEAYDAMTNEHPYKAKLSSSEAINEIKINAGTQFDVDIAKVFVEKVLGEK